MQEIIFAKTTFKLKCFNTKLLLIWACEMKTYIDMCVHSYVYVYKYI